VRHKLLQIAEKPYLKTDLPEVCIGDEVSVSMRIREGEKERIQKFDGLVIAKGGKDSSALNITVRKISGKIGVERIFLLHSPLVKEVKILATGADVRRSKLYYMRERRGKKARIKYSKVNR